MRGWYDWDPADADRLYRRSRDLGPGSAVVRRQYALFLAVRGRSDEAIAEARVGVSMDPLSPLGNYYLASVLFYTARFDEAAEQCRKTLDLEPNYFPVRQTLAMVLSSTEHHEEAVSTLEAGRQDADDVPMTEALLGQEYARVGRLEEARAILDSLKRRRKAGYLLVARPPALS